MDNKGVPLSTRRMQDLMPDADLTQLARPILDAVNANPHDWIQAQWAVTATTWTPAYERAAAIRHEATAVYFQNQAIGARYLLTQAGIDDPDGKLLLTTVADAAIAVERTGPRNQPGLPSPHAYKTAAVNYPRLTWVEAAAVAGWVHGDQHGRSDTNSATAAAIGAVVKEQLGEEHINRTLVPVRTDHGVQQMPAAAWLAHHTSHAARGQEAVGAALGGVAQHHVRPPWAVTQAFRPMTAVSAAGPTERSQPAVAARPAAHSRGR